MEIRTAVLVILAIFAILFVFYRWRRGDYGTVSLSPEAGDVFNNFRTGDSRNYFISGPEACPHAIMGIEKGWALSPGLWKEIESSPALMQTLVQQMKTKYVSLYGFDLSDRRKTKIGILYSTLDVHIVIRIIGHNEIEVSSALDNSRL